MRNVVVWFLLVGCGSQDGPSQETPAGEPLASGPQTAGAPTAAPPASLPALPEGQVVEVDGASSSFEWVGAKVTKEHPGGFTSYQGRVVIGAEENVLGTEFVVDMASVFSDSEKLTKHLKNVDFFDVATFTSARFASADIQTGEGGGHVVTGSLDLHGNTRVIEFPATISVTETMVTVQAEFQLNRQDFGVSYPGKPDDLIKDQVQIKLNLNFPR